MPLEELSLAARSGQLDAYRSGSRDLAVVCSSGQRSAQAVVRLTKVLGFEKVVNVSGGVQQWVAAGYELETGTLPGGAALARGGGGGCGSGCGCH
jgi:rhodanese-related sulfurtransferase